MKKISHNYNNSTHYIEFDVEEKEIGEDTEFIGSGQYKDNSQENDVEYCGNHFSKPFPGSPPYEEREIGYMNKNIYDIADH